MSCVATIAIDEKKLKVSFLAEVKTTSQQNDDYRLFTRIGFFLSNIFSY